ncbi:glycosyltransferase family 4 protein [Mycolicibacterium vaccae]|uniref:glycosyltransferase family 4 protein n=1 Tax=Mycolicibacterium vaccae TaxID=1810 RepID=UPI003CF63F32
MAARTRDSKPRVGFLSPVAFFKGGAERSLFDLMDNPSIKPILLVTEQGPVAEEAAKRNIDVAIVPFGNVSTIRRPIRVSTIFRSIIDWLRAARTLASLAESNSIAIIHTNGLKAHSVAALSSVFGGPPFVSHIRDIAHTWVEKRIWQGLARLSAHTILVSHACWPGKSLPANVSVIYNSVLQSQDQLSRPVRIKDELVVGICGRIHPYKGVHLALDWIAAARNRGINVRLVIRGDAAEEEASYVRGLESEVDRLGLRDQVCFEGRKDGLMEIYSGLDAVLVPSSTPDPLPRSVMEAFSFGIPVIGYPAGGIIEMIEPGCNGWFANSGETFCAAIEEIKELGPEGTSALRSMAAKTVEERFSRPRMFAELDTVYRQVLSSKRGRTVSTT